MKNATSSLIAPEIRHIYIIYIIKLHIIYYNYILYIIIMYYILNILIFILHYYILYYVSCIIYYTLYLNIYLSRLIPQVAENAAARESIPYGCRPEGEYLPGGLSEAGVS